jgi:hypothetical protein
LARFLSPKTQPDFLAARFAGESDRRWRANPNVIRFLPQVVTYVRYLDHGLHFLRSPEVPAPY